jgi:hypothetical protein
MPICSTELELEPSIPTHVAEYSVPEPVTAGTVQDPLTEVTESVVESTAYPDQFVLVLVTDGASRFSNSSRRKTRGF